MRQEMTWAVLARRSEQVGIIGIGRTPSHRQKTTVHLVVVCDKTGSSSTRSTRVPMVGEE